MCSTRIPTTANPPRDHRRNSGGRQLNVKFVSSGLFVYCVCIPLDCTFTQRVAATSGLRDGSLLVVVVLGKLKVPHVLLDASDYIL